MVNIVNKIMLAFNNFKWKDLTYLNLNTIIHLKHLMSFYTIILKKCIDSFDLNFLQFLFNKFFILLKCYKI